METNRTHDPRTRSVGWKTLLVFILLGSPTSSSSFSSPGESKKTPQSLSNKNDKNDNKIAEVHHYDVVVIGAGAAGLFASGAVQMFGKRVALVETASQLGGDCTNSACVPSKGLRAAAQLGMSWQEAQNYVNTTVNLVRQRENPRDMQERASSDALQIYQVQSGRFVGSRELKVTLSSQNREEEIRIRGKTFIIATGASPIVPITWQQQAKQADVPLFTYRSVLRPEMNTDFWKRFGSSTTTTKRGTRVNVETPVLAIVGGGATACELSQSLARLGHLQILLIAPQLLSSEDGTLQTAALELLTNEQNIEIVTSRLVEIQSNQTLLLENGQSTVPVQGVLVCVGRSPNDALQQLDLHQANVQVVERNSTTIQPGYGVLVHPHTLQSVSACHIYAVGDCASAVSPRFRTASHAAWTGFHAVRNALVPRLLRLGSRTSIHPCVPRVIYTDPELASVGLTRRECETKYGADGFDVLLIREQGSDRADMERACRNTSVTFLELRAEKGGGKVLGLTCCSPAAAEMANSMGMAITNKLTARDVARSLHSYPSYSYLLHRVALSMALSDVWGLLEACGPVGRFLAIFGRFVQRLFGRIKLLVTSFRKQSSTNVPVIE